MDLLKMGTKIAICAIILFGFCFVIFILSMNHWQNKFDILKEEMTEIKGKMATLKEENGKLKNEIPGRNDEFIGQIFEQKVEFEEKMATLEGQFKESFPNLTESNDENVNELLNEFNLNSYKWNINKEFGRELNISDDGLTVKYSTLEYGLNTALSNLPIPAFNFSAKNLTILFYYEVKIISRRYGYSRIGFCDKNQPLKELGNMNNSIGIRNKRAIIINGSWIILENSIGDLQNGDVIGVGIVYSPKVSQIELFVTFNGKLLGKVELPLKFATIRLFPALNLFSSGQTFRANFGTEQFHFNTSKFLQEFNFNSYKWNVDKNFGPELSISWAGHRVIYLLENAHNVSSKVNWVAANLPIPTINLKLSSKNPSICFYYEVKILENNYIFFQLIESDDDIAIGFCDKQHFPLGCEQLGYGNNSIGMNIKKGLQIEGSSRMFSMKIENYDVVGLGIVYFPANTKIECFVTLNGQFIGNVGMPLKYATLQLFPAANLFKPFQVIQANFGNEQFLFNTSKFLQEMN